MSKIKVFVVAAIIICTTGHAMAQKSAYISMQDILSLMPEVRKLDTLLQRYQTDSLNPQFQYMVSEYNRKDSVVSGKDSSKTPASVRTQIRQELEGLAYQIQNWQTIAQNQMQNKRDQLLEPIYRRAMVAIQDVAKENGYGYVYNREALVVAPPADDLLPLVAKRLNIKLPTGAGAGGAAGAGASATTPGTRKK